MATHTGGHATRLPCVAVLATPVVLLGMQAGLSLASAAPANGNVLPLLPTASDPLLRADYPSPASSVLVLAHSRSGFLPGTGRFSCRHACAATANRHSSALSPAGKFLLLYKRAAHRVVLSSSGDLICRPSYLERTASIREKKQNEYIN